MKPNILTCIILVGLATSQSMFCRDLPLAEGVTNSIVELRDKDEDVRLRAKLRLLRPEVRQSLSAHGKELIELLKDYESSQQSALLLGQIDLPKELAAAVAASRATPDPVKARLGDKQAEARVCARFNEAKNLYEFAEASRQLLYVGTPVAKRAFVEGLGSTNIFQDVHGNLVSQTYLLLQAYGQAHPSESLFAQSEIARHSELSEKEFQQEPHQLFLRAVRSHFQKVVGVPVQVQAPFFTQTVNPGVRLRAIKQ